MLRIFQVTQIPWFDLLWYKNPILAKLRPTTSSQILKLVHAAISERREKIRKDGDSGFDVINGDMLSRFLGLQKTNSSVPSW
jgi:hypothetical protein